MGKAQKKTVSAYFVTLYYKHLIFIQIVVKEIKKKKKKHQQVTN